MTLTNVKHQNDGKIGKDLLQVALSHISEAVIITDEQNRFVYVNQQFERLSGYTLKEVKGKTPKYFRSRIEEEDFYTEMKHEVNTDGRWQGELWNRKKNGELYLQSLSIIAYKNESGKICNYIGVISNLFQNQVVMLENGYTETYY